MNNKNQGDFEMKYDIAVVIGRWQPYHLAHHELVTHALSLSKKVLILLGSAKTSPDIRNPFSPELREKMIRGSFPPDVQHRLEFYGLWDFPYNETVWITQVQNIVKNAKENLIDLPENKDSMHNIELGKIKTALVGHFKDNTSYYLKHFPQWTFESFNKVSLSGKKYLSASDIRDIYLKGDYSRPKLERENWLLEYVPAPVCDYLEEFSKTELYKNLRREYKYTQDYIQASKFVGLPFKPTFVTTDCVVSAHGHILVVKRGVNPGKGKLALPGGFLEHSLTLKANALKELKEETRINIPAVILEASIKDHKVFDYPERSLRGRTITHAFYLELNTKMEDGLPNVRGGDDASGAFWIPISELLEREDEMFEDHASIVKICLGIG